jgi:hypothetical protein
LYRPGKTTYDERVERLKKSKKYEPVFEFVVNNEAARKNYKESFKVKKVCLVKDFSKVWFPRKTGKIPTIAKKCLVNYLKGFEISNAVDLPKVVDLLWDIRSKKRALRIPKKLKVFIVEQVKALRMCKNVREIASVILNANVKTLKKKSSKVSDDQIELSHEILDIPYEVALTIEKEGYSITYNSEWNLKIPSTPRNRDYINRKYDKAEERRKLAAPKQISPKFYINAPVTYMERLALKVAYLNARGNRENHKVITYKEHNPLKVTINEPTSKEIERSRKAFKEKTRKEIKEIARRMEDQDEQSDYEDYFY